MSAATLSGVTAPRVTTQVPAWGAWWADVALDTDATLTGEVVLAMSGIEAHGTIVSGGPVHGRAAYRIVGGHGGWGRTLPPKAYRDSAGVKLRSVLQDAASSVGESLATLPATRVGPHYARQRGPASGVLNELLPRAWHVDFAGVTQPSLRPSAAYTGTAVRVRGPDRAIGVVELAPESLVGLVPGVIVDGLPPAVDVEYVLDEKRLTVLVYAGSVLPRRVAALARILDALDPRRRYRGVFEFRVVTQDGERMNLQPVRASSGMSNLAGVPVRPGMAGLRATVLPGCLVLVAFADADPSRPCVVNFDDPDSPGWMPTELDLGMAPRLGIARMTDPVQAGPFAGTITLASLISKAGV